MKRNPDTALLGHFYQPFLRFNFYVIVAHSVRFAEEYARLTLKEGQIWILSNDNSDTSQARVWSSGAHGSLMCLRYDALKVSLLAHEAFHVTHYHFDGRGIKLSDDSEEAYAYHIDMLMKQLLEWLLDNNLKPLLQ